jgi:hypothetical protein
VRHWRRAPYVHILLLFFFLQHSKQVGRPGHVQVAGERAERPRARCLLLATQRHPSFFRNHPSELSRGSKATGRANVSSAQGNAARAALMSQRQSVMVCASTLPCLDGKKQTGDVAVATTIGALPCKVTMTRMRLWPHLHHAVHNLPARI